MEAEIFWAAFGGALSAGLVTMVALFAVEWFRHHLDRPLINASTSLGFIMGALAGNADALAGDQTRKLFLHAKNPSTHPVVINSFGLEYKRDLGALFVTPQAGWVFPYELAGGHGIQQWVDVLVLIESLKSHGRTPSDLKKVYFQASSGKSYSSNIDRKTIKELNDEFDSVAA